MNKQGTFRPWVFPQRALYSFSIFLRVLGRLSGCAHGCRKSRHPPYSPWSRESLGFWVVVAALQLWEAAEVWGWRNKQWCCFWRRRKCSVVATILKYTGMKKKFTVSCLVARSYTVSMEGGGVNEVQLAQAREALTGPGFTSWVPEAISQI